MKTEKEKLDEDYKRFSVFWEKARKWKDEDGDEFIDWDKSVIGQFCFNNGFEAGKSEAIKDKKLVPIEKVMEIIDFGKATDWDNAEAQLIYDELKSKIGELAK